MAKEIIIYHGSEFIIEKPEFGKGKPYNDYGRGFYCTEKMDLAKEWAVNEVHDGYANEYVLDIEGLRILDLSSPSYNVLHWITVLLKNRTFSLFSDISKEGKKYLLEHYSLSMSDFDLVKGYRADDSYFAFAESFLDNTISLRRLSEALRLGDLGEQIVLTSPASFEKTRFVKAIKADSLTYWPLRQERNEKARLAFLKDRKGGYREGDVYLIDIIRGAYKP